MVDPEVRHLRSFLAAAEELHFGRAAARLHLTQQALSGHVQQLETRLGTVLFDRTTRRVALTASGQALLGPARRVLAEMADAVTAVRAAHAATERNLRVGVFGFAAYRLLPQITRQLAVRHPEVTVTQVEVPHRRAVLDRQVDVALGTPLELPPGLAATTVCWEHVVVALPHGHRLAGQPEVTLPELSTELVAGPAAGVAREWDHMIAQAAQAAGVVLAPAPATFGNLATALGVAAEQRYPALLTSDARHWPLPGVQLRDLHPPLPWATAVLWATNHPLPEVDAFLQAASPPPAS